MQKVKAFQTLPKTYFFDTKTKHIILAHYATEDVATDLADIPAGRFAFVDFDGLVRVVSPKEFEARFKKVSDIYGMFHGRDIENTTLNLKTLKEDLISIKQTEENIIDLELKNKTITLVYKDPKLCQEDLRHLRFLLAVANRTM